MKTIEDIRNELAAIAAELRAEDAGAANDLDQLNNTFYTTTTEYLVEMMGLIQRVQGRGGAPARFGGLGRFGGAGGESPLGVRIGLERSPVGARRASSSAGIGLGRCAPVSDRVMVSASHGPAAG